MDVQMPDGTTIQGVPDGITKSQLLEKYQKSQSQSSGNGSFLDRTGEDYNKRISNMQQSANSYVSGNQSGLETAFQFGGQALNYGLNDIPSEAIASGIKVIPDSVKNVAKNVYSTVANSPVGYALDNTAGYVLDQAGQGYNKFKQNNPRAGRNLDAALGYGSALAAALPIKGESLPSQVVGTGQNIVKKTAELIPSKTLSNETETLALRKSASDLYKQSVAEDIQIPEKQVSDLNSALVSLKPKTDLEQRAWASSAAAKQAQNITDSIATENPSFNGLLAQRTELNSKIKVATRSGDDAEAYKLNRVKDALDETMMGSDTGKWAQANHQWAQQAILGDTDEIVNKALTRAQPANSLDTAINNYLNSYKSNGLSTEERKALEDVIKNSSLDKLKRGAASGLTKYVTGAVGSQGGPVGAAAGYLMGHYGSEFLKDSAMAAKVEKLDKFRELIMNRKPPIQYPVSQSAFEPPMNISQRIKANKK